MELSHRDNHEILSKLHSIYLINCSIYIYVCMYAFLMVKNIEDFEILMHQKMVQHDVNDVFS